MCAPYTAHRNTSVKVSWLLKRREINKKNTHTLVLCWGFSLIGYWCCCCCCYCSFLLCNISLIQINLIKYALHYEMGQRFIYYFSWNCLNSKQEINIEGLNERGGGSKAGDFLFYYDYYCYYYVESPNAREYEICRFIFIYWIFSDLFPMQWS